MKNKTIYISNLCKENNPEACQDCSNLRCKCSCHNLNINEDNSYLTLDENETLEN